MKLSDIGEREAIRLISQAISTGNVAVGIGDDCAAIDIDDQNYLLVSTDMVSKKAHLPREITPFQMGWFIVAVNLSDIAAKGGEPIGIVLSLGLPKNTSIMFLQRLIEGANRCATKFDTAIIGGDTKENPHITLCGTILGRVKKDEFMPRKGAQPGDIVAVTGTLGKAAAGYYALKHKIQNKEIVKGLLQPIPRIKEGRALAEKKTVSSCMDISDGISASLYQLGELNNVGFEICREKIPISPELIYIQQQTKIDVYNAALHFGGDYELLITMPADHFEKTAKAVENTGNKLTPIGRVTKTKSIKLVSKHIKNILPNQGYEHFRQTQKYDSS
ncbi:MAG: thiamine-phosphate kinase [Thermoplasmata archaeon]|nr:MAG: thiamine-phosphate kinase [Thermoplasmata archaeon]RLF36905.1 MAG: thiamine-phosphate kinase [Thermoplasmata archaeon]